MANVDMYDFKYNILNLIDKIISYHALESFTRNIFKDGKIMIKISFGMTTDFDSRVMFNILYINNNIQKEYKIYNSKLKNKKSKSIMTNYKNVKFGNIRGKKTDELYNDLDDINLLDYINNKIKCMY